MDNPTPTQEAVDQLRQHPELAQEFDKTFGTNSSRDYLQEGQRSFASGTITESDIIKYPELLNVARNDVIAHAGRQAVENAKPEDIVNLYLNNRRGVAAGNTVRVYNNYSAIKAASDDPVRLEAMRQGQILYDSMANIYSSDVSWADKGSIALDWGRSLALDPINAATFGVGRFAASGAAKVATKVATEAAMEAALKKAAETGVTRLAIEQAGSKVVAKSLEATATQKAGTALVTAAATKGAEEAGAKGVQKLFTRAALREVGASTGLDAASNAISEYVNQKGYVAIGTQDEVNKTAIAGAALASIGIGALQGGSILLKGSKPAVLPHLTYKPADISKADPFGKLAKNIGVMANPDMKRGIWKEAVAEGRKLENVDSEFFLTMLTGVKDAGTDTPIFKGLVQIAQEEGLVFSKNGVDDKVANWARDFIANNLKQDQVKPMLQALEKASGITITDIEKATPESVANMFASSANKAGRMLSGLGKLAKSLGKAPADVTMGDMLDDVAGVASGTHQSIISRALDQLPDITHEATIAVQNTAIRMMVSHPSTSYLNMFGWAFQSGLGSTTDIATALIHSSGIALKQAVGMVEKGVDPWKAVKHILTANAKRSQYILDPMMQVSKYRSIMELRGKALKDLDRVMSGGVDNAEKALENSAFGPNVHLLGQKINKVVDVTQELALVKGQDIFTKSQEFVYQLDKNLRNSFNKGWDDFFSAEDLAKQLATPEYRQAEIKAVQTTLERLSAKSYASKGLIGEVAAVIEDAHNLPGIGLLVPFGRFFNNTVDFMSQHTLLAVGMKAVSKKYSDKSFTELFTKGAVGLGLTASLIHQEDLNRRMGLDIGQTIDLETGEVKDVKFLYPLNIFKYFARFASYRNAGIEVPKDVRNQFYQDVGLGQITRNFSQTSGDIMSIFASLAGTPEEQGRSISKTLEAIGSQLISATTRPLEPLNMLVGIATDDTGDVPARKIGSSFTNNSLRYLDQIIPAVTGEPMAPQAYTAAEGAQHVQYSKLFGYRRVPISNVDRILNVLGSATYTINAPSSVTNKSPEVANIYNQTLSKGLDVAAGELLDAGFLDWNPTKQAAVWKETLNRQQDVAKTVMTLDSIGSGSGVDVLYEISSKHSWNDIDKALNALSEAGGKKWELNDLNRTQLQILRSWLDSQPTIQRLAP